MDREDNSLEQGTAPTVYDQNFDVQPVASPVVGTGAGRRLNDNSPFRFNKFAFGLTGVVTAIILLVGGGFLLLSKQVGNRPYSPEAATTPAANYNVGDLKLDDIDGVATLTPRRGEKLAIHGQLQVANTLVVSPTSAPEKATAGQIYYDQNTNSLSYYNGQNYVVLGPGLQGPIGPAGPNGLPGKDGVQGPQGPQGPAGIASCPYGDCLSLQSSTPGTQEAGHINISGTVAAGSLLLGGDANLYQSNNLFNYTTPAITTDNRFIANVVSSGTSGFVVGVQGESRSRAELRANGLYFGDGASALDTNLYRSAANTLKTDYAFTAAGTITTNGNLRIDASAPILRFNETDTTKNWYQVADNNDLDIRENSTDGTNTRLKIAPSGSSSYFQTLAGSDMQQAFQIRSSTVSVLNVDTANGRIGVGFGVTAPTYALDVNGTINAGGSTPDTSGTLRVGNGSSGAFTITGNGSTGNATLNNANTTGGTISMQNRGVTTFSLQGSNGAALFQNSANSTAALQVKNAGGSSLFKVDSSTTSNLLSNPSIEVDTAGWSAKGGATLSRVTTKFYHGDAGLSIVTPATANAGASFAYTFTPNTQYSLSLEVRAVGTGFATFSVGRQDNGTDIDCLTNQSVTSGNWTRFSCTFTTGATISGSNIYVKQSDATGRTFVIDAIQLETGATATPFQIGLIKLDGVVNSPTVFKNYENSTTAFQIQNAAGTNLLAVNTTSGQLAIGPAAVPANGVLTVGTNTTTASGGLYFGTDTNLYRSAADTLKTDDSFNAVGNVRAQFDTANQINLGNIGVGTGGISFGLVGDTNLYRQGADSLATDDAFLVKTASNSTNAFQVQNATGSTVAGVDTTNQKMILTNNNVGSNTVLELSNGTDVAQFKIGANGNLTINQPTNLSADITIDAQNELMLGNTATDSITLGRTDMNIQTTVRGTALFQVAVAESNTAFQIQNTTGTSLFVADTVNMRVGIGVPSPQYTLDVSGDINATGKIKEDGNNLLPAGAMMMFMGASAPAGWLLCDGSAVSRTTYADLFAAFGTIYGAGDGLTTFNLPDCRGRVAVGLGSNAEVNALTDNDGLAEGSRKIKHKHGTGTLSINNHQLTTMYGGTLGIQDNNDRPANMYGGTLRDAGANIYGHSISGEVGDTTGPLDGPAYQVVNYIIKY